MALGVARQLRDRQAQLDDGRLQISLLPQDEPQGPARLAVLGVARDRGPELGQGTLQVALEPESEPQVVGVAGIARGQLPRSSQAEHRRIEPLPIRQDLAQQPMGLGLRGLERDGLPELLLGEIDIAR